MAVNGLFLFLLVPLLGIICFTAICALAILKRDSRRGGRAMRAEEARMIQDMYKELSEMSKRVEALETILLDHRKANEEPENEREQ